MHSQFFIRSAPKPAHLIRMTVYFHHPFTKSFRTVTFDDIQTPTVILDWSRVSQNIDRMIARSRHFGWQLRPHMKTAQCLTIYEYFRRKGVDTITCSSLDMAAYFAKGGCRDITVAFPVNVRQMDTIRQLAGSIQLNLLVVNSESIHLVGRHCPASVGIFIKIDTGARRTGLLPDDHEGIEACLATMANYPHLRFRGFLTHAGHSYRTRSQEEILRVHNESANAMRKLKSRYGERYPSLVISTGDTPTCSVADAGWEGIDECRPGNFVFYDLMQVAIGSCKLEDIGVVLACPVVALHPDRYEAIVYGGGIHLSKDRIEWQGNEIYGLPVLLEPSGWQAPEPGNYMRSLSQEHGVLHCTPAFFEKLRIGQLVGILPVHSCMMVDIATHYRLLSGEKWGKFHSALRDGVEPT